NDKFVIRGTEAGATFDRGSDELTVHEARAFDGDHHHFSDTVVETRESDSHAAEQATFLDAVAAGEAPAINTIDEALSVQRVIDAIYRSSDRGEAVRLD
ncbi:gfo/Idh/MocA family oxidoreductase, partial [Halorubrum sp. AD140]|uniref:Gfo/Idh/MocA family oxidoreductase n=1 Tax=Halorubrum sp. AD140 TaxID=3050073 RepID=UPI002ACD0800|nr:gfo/Idh/MocA family oxidoreductase [Halorubrum sp. AD140]